jgi:hypothetical protein
MARRDVVRHAAAGEKERTLSVSAMNVLNHANYAPPSGDLSSPFFGCTGD